MFRVRDIKEDKWLRGDYFLSQNDDLVMLEKKAFGRGKISIMSDTRYVCQRDIGYDDKNGRRIYEGDICRISTDEKVADCVVAYVPSYAAYMMFDYKNSEYYEFYQEVQERTTVVGNVFENKNLIEVEEVSETEEVDE